jgi:putative mycofactocin binding protein MftB
VSTDPSLGFDLDIAWVVHPSVSVRPERFGALLYHFGTRRLSFLRSRSLLAVVEALADAPTARDALTHVDERECPAIEQALATLAASNMIQPRPTSSHAA